MVTSANDNQRKDFLMSKIDLHHGDCLEVMDKLIKQGIKVDAIITDPPYGTTACKWDSIIPFPDMWERLNKLIKPNGAIVLFGSEPFSSALRMSNIKNYKYDWVWDKVKPSGHLIAKHRPMTHIENILILFSKLFMDIFLLKTLKFDVEGSKQIVLEFVFFKLL